MSVGAARTYENALKAFRRGCHQFPSCWRAAVVCGSNMQARRAMDEAALILRASSLDVQHVNGTGMQITTSKGGELRFYITDASFVDRIRGVDFPQFIILCGIGDDTAEKLKWRNKHDFIDEKYCRWDDVVGF